MHTGAPYWSANECITASVTPAGHPAVACVGRRYWDDEADHDEGQPVMTIKVYRMSPDGRPGGSLVTSPTGDRERLPETLAYLPCAGPCGKSAMS